MFIQSYISRLPIKSINCSLNNIFSYSCKILCIHLIIIYYAAEPEKLESKFRLTYSMLLSLFRAESFSVESMMSHSFCEMSHMSSYDKLNVALERTKKELNSELSEDMGGHLQHLFDFYAAASDYIETWENIHVSLIKFGTNISVCY